MCRPVVTYLSMRAFRIVRLQPLANVPAQRMQRTNAFAAARRDKAAMRPFTKLLVWTFVDYAVHRQTEKHRLTVGSENRQLPLFSVGKSKYGRRPLSAECFPSTERLASPWSSVGSSHSASVDIVSTLATWS